MNSESRYHWAVVLTHWLVAAIVLIETGIGVLYLHEMPNGAGKIPFLTIHMVLGLLLLALMTVRVVARVVTKAPEKATSGSRILDWLASATHFFLYLLGFILAASGLLLATSSHVLQLVSGGTVALPMQFSPFLHAAIFLLFGMLVFFHTAAALYHQFVLRDNLMRRMWFSRRYPIDRAMGRSMSGSMNRSAEATGMNTAE